MTESLSQRRLNRATLARQLLLEPSRASVVKAVERIGGLQAQEPASPFIGLWARLATFETADLDAAIRARDDTRVDLRTPALLGALGRFAEAEIGRASCRERVSSVV